MSDLTIPNEVVYAFQKAWANKDTLSTAECLAAAIRAWPGMMHYPSLVGSAEEEAEEGVIFLPLPLTPEGQG